MTSQLSISIGSTELGKKTDDGFVLAIARMVENTYSSIWDARIPASSMSASKYTWTATYAIAAADNDLDDNTQTPSLSTQLLPIVPGQDATLKNNTDQLQPSKVNPGSHSCVFRNSSSNDVRAVLLQDLKVDGNLVPGVPGASSACNAVAISGSVAKTKGSVQLTPRWNVYAGDDGFGDEQDSIAVWWVQADLVNNSGAIDDKNGPNIEDENTIVFCMPVGGKATLNWSDSKVWTPKVTAPKAKALDDDE